MCDSMLWLEQVQNQYTFLTRLLSIIASLRDFNSAESLRTKAPFAC